MEHVIDNYLDWIDEQMALELSNAADRFEYEAWLENGALPFEEVFGGLIESGIESEA